MNAKYQFPVVVIEAYIIPATLAFDWACPVCRKINTETDDYIYPKTELTCSNCDNNCIAGDIEFREEV